MENPEKQTEPQRGLLKWQAITITLLICSALSIWGIYGFGVYGIALFVLTPLLLGSAPVLLSGPAQVSDRKTALKLGLLTLSLFLAGLLLFAIEGLICIAMAAPIGIALGLLGSIFAYEIIKSISGKSTPVLLIFCFLIPGTAFVERRQAPETTCVQTAIEINAPAAEVWKQVIAFPQLSEPSEWLFKAGIAYPINATIQGSGVGAIRHCNFTTGSFVEPITVWKEAELLAFSVTRQPAPMTELSFWDIDAPHLHDYFVSERGQFKLTPLPGDKTLLQGSTWYTHKIQPAFYWSLWSEYIVHRIHLRVLKHIRSQAEQQ